MIFLGREESKYHKTPAPNPRGHPPNVQNMLRYSSLITIIPDIFNGHVGGISGATRTFVVTLRIFDGDPYLMALTNSDHNPRKLYKEATIDNVKPGDNFQPSFYSTSVLSDMLFSLLLLVSLASFGGVNATPGSCFITLSITTISIEPLFQASYVPTNFKIKPD